MVEEKKEKKLRLFTGIVISKKMQKTATVLLEWLRKDPLVKKIVRVKRKVHVHDPRDEAHVGDIVSFYEGKPISKSKNMYFHAIVKQNKDAAVLEG